MVTMDPIVIKEGARWLNSKWNPATSAVVHTHDAEISFDRSTPIRADLMSLISLR